MFPCGGLTVRDDPRIDTYLHRPAQTAAGSRSEHTIASDRFDGRNFADISADEQRQVLDIKMHGNCWTLDHDDCREEVPANRKAADGRLLSCECCTAILSDRAFKKMLRKPLPSDASFRYTNKRYRKTGWAGIFARIRGVKEIIEDPDPKHSVGVRYALGVLQGKYSENEVFTSLVEGMVLRQERKERGVGLQNFRWSRPYDIFASAIRIQSPRTYRLLEQHIPMPAERHLRRKEASRPKIPIEIGRQTFILAAERLNMLNYFGPVALSCDDTKLFAAFRLFWDAARKTYTLIGATDGPHDVVDAEQVESVMKSLDLVKVTKVRVWVLQVPLPKVTPIILAAMPLDALDMPDLHKPLNAILDGLNEQCISVISYSCDGTEAERSLQREKQRQSTHFIRHSIPSPRPGGSDLDISILTFEAVPLTMVQDSKHALKTFRNNLLSGARLLTLGNYTAMYGHVRAAAFEDDSPLYHRDVEKVDRQDDNAASRLFSASSLQFFATHHPEDLGVIVYLFVLGDLVDAWQNRSISHLERVKMVLRARYFLVLWSKYLESAQYKLPKHFISREAADIASFLISALISLIIVYRDHLGLEYPLLPWLHSTEASGLDAAVLGKFPTNEQINSAAVQASDEADSLIHLLGVNPNLVRAGFKVLPSGQSSVAWPVHLPTLPDGSGDLDGGHGPSGGADDSESAHEFDYDSEPGGAQQLQDIFNAEEVNQWSDGTKAPRSHALDEKLLALTCASFAVMADEQTKLDELPELDDHAIQAFHSEESKHIYDALSESQRGVFDFPDDVSPTFTLTQETLDLTALVDIRRAHETDHARRGVRTAKVNTSLDSNTNAAVHRQLLEKFRELLKSEQDSQAPGTGNRRIERWTTKSRGPSKPADDPQHAPVETGNAANASAAASAAAKRALKKRRTIVQRSLPLLEDLVTARISTFRPLRLHDCAIVSRNLLKGWWERHAAVNQVENVAAISYVAVEAYSHVVQRQFSVVPHMMAAWQTKRFALLPSYSLLFLTGAPTALARAVEMPVTDADMFRKLQLDKHKLPGLMKAFRKLGAAAPEVHDDGDSLDEVGAGQRQKFGHKRRRPDAKSGQTQAPTEAGYNPDKI
ncbi:hypothetical protein FA95DRAFT_1577642 [Auriscalpium vulgare]|uniref:Uncharacterized protein n=1 Tax=Auriscalpium vulgare TaxID=40419 RepID=A0ACB8R716_9AGAM|nr:hypothetical protein FA95DRAFT_1577642 [Auriscalpium vulgare]